MKMTSGIQLHIKKEHSGGETIIHLRKRERILSQFYCRNSTVKKSVELQLPLGDIRNSTEKSEEGDGEEDDANEYDTNTEKNRVHQQTYSLLYFATSCNQCQPKLVRSDKKEEAFTLNV